MTRRTGAEVVSGRASVVAVVAVVVLGAVGCCAVALRQRPGTLEVRVVDGEVPVVGATVRAYGEKTWFGEVPTLVPAGDVPLTDADGCVRFGEVAPSTIHVDVRHDEFVPSGANVTIGHGEHVRHVLTLSRGARVQGRVRQADGTPVRGATVEVDREPGAADAASSPAAPLASARTDADGAFLTPGFEPQGSLLLAVSAVGPASRTLARCPIPRASAGVNTVGEFRVLDTRTVLRLQGAPPESHLRVYLSLDAKEPDGSPRTWRVDNLSFNESATAEVIGLPDGHLTWRLIESKLGPAPNEIPLSEGTAELTGRERAVEIGR